MSVRSHLDATASSLLLRRPESAAISTSLDVLYNRLGYDDIYPQLRDRRSFGSWVRETNLPREVDMYSDVDYMIVFKGNEYELKPQTLLDRIKRFVARRYATSEVKQDHPTILLSLNHIHIELVPAVRSGDSDYGNLLIPSVSGYNNWQTTYPEVAAQALAKKNQDNQYAIKPVVRLLKYWNCSADYGTRPFTSFELEQNIIQQYYYNCLNVKDYFYSAVEGLPVAYGLSDFCRNRIARLKEVVTNTKRLEAALKSVEAENEIKKVIPSFV